MTDKIEKLGRSLIQHGVSNNRIYLLKLDSSDLPEIIPQLNAIAEKNGYSKIFAKIPEPCLPAFLEDGFIQEGSIPYFYSGQVAASFCGKFINPERKKTEHREEIEKIIELAQSKRNATIKPLPKELSLRMATEADASELADLYKVVFRSYPFPIHDSDYLIETMRTNVVYFVAEKNGKIVAASSGEMDLENHNAEMTDFATSPDHLGLGLAVHLLQFMESEMKKRNILTLYTIARAISPGMNITFSKCGYHVGGTLINNTQISGTIENMNLWYKTA